MQRWLASRPPQHASGRLNRPGLRSASILALLLVAMSVGGACGRRAPSEAPAQAPAAVPVTIATVRAQEQPVTIEATGSFEADESSDVAPDSSGRVVATPVDVGQFVKEGAVLVRLQGIDAGLRLDEARAAVSRAEANAQARRVAERRWRRRRRSATRRCSPPATSRARSPIRHAPAPKHRCRTSTPRAPRWRRPGRSSRWRRRRSPTSSCVAPFAGFISQRACLARRVRAAVDGRRHAAQDRSAAAAADHSRRPGRADPRRPDGHAPRSTRSRSSPSRAAITAVNPAISAESRSFMRRGARAESRRDAQARACSRSRPSIRAGPAKTMLVPRAR